MSEGRLWAPSSGGLCLFGFWGKRTKGPREVKMAGGSHHLTGERWSRVRVLVGLQSALSIFPDKSVRVPQGPLQGPGQRRGGGCGGQCCGPLAPPCDAQPPQTCITPLSFLLPFPWVAGRAAELIPQTAFEPRVWVRVLLRVKLGREFILIPRGPMGPKGSQAWKERPQGQTKRRAGISPSLLSAPPDLPLRSRGSESTRRRRPALGADGGVSRRQERAGWLRSARARFWTNQLQLGMGSGCTKGLLGLTTLSRREGPADRRGLDAGRTDRVTCGAGGHTPRPRLHKGRVVAVSGKPRRNDTCASSLPFQPLPSPPSPSPALSQSCFVLFSVGGRPGGGFENSTELGGGEIRWACK